MIFLIKKIRGLVLLRVLFSHVTLSHFVKFLKILIIAINSVHEMCLFYRVKIRKIFGISFQSALLSHYQRYISETITLRLLIFWYFYSFHYFSWIIVIFINFTYVKTNLSFLDEVKFLISNYLIDAFVWRINSADKFVWYWNVCFCGKIW